jgi:large subunit ribosomal protein L16
MLIPKKTKYRKTQRGRLTGKASRNISLTYGDYGLQALEPAWITSKQIEAVRRTISRYTKRSGKILIKIFPDKPITARSPESRMGSGKGSVEFWVACVRPGNVLFEIIGISESVAFEALKNARYKLPLKTKILKNYEKIKK